MPGCEDVGSCGRLVLFPQEKRGFCDRLEDKTRGARHCCWGNRLPSVEAALASGAPLTHRPGRGREKDGISHRGQPQLLGKLYIRAVLTGLILSRDSVPGDHIYLSQRSHSTRKSHLGACGPRAGLPYFG